MAREYRAHRVWHIEQRGAYAYATNQFGGFTRHDTREQASAAIDRDIAEYGDTRIDPEPPATADDEHRLENHGKIYFSLGPGEPTWRLDPASVDGYSLDGLDETECTYGNRHVCAICRTDSGQAELDRAESTPLPTGRDVLDMLAAHYGYTLTARPDSAEPHESPDQLLARFRTALHDLDVLATAYTAHPGNDTDSSATATYTDRRSELLDAAVDAAAALDAAATLGRWPQAWAPPASA